MTTRQDAETLKARLEAGYERIDVARQKGVDTRAWTDFWITLLHEYETVCDELEQAPLAGMEGRRWTSR